MISIRNLSKEYSGGVKALSNINLEIKKGELVVLLGLSGAGKSTLLRCINGLIKPTAGEVEVNCLKVSNCHNNMRKVRQQVGMIFQQFNLVKQLSVINNVLCGRLAYSGILTSCCRFFSESELQLAQQALEKVGLADKIHQRADQLSGGQQQRVGIARALVQQPKVLLADEPVASLDPKSTHTIMEILARINKEEGLTCLFSLHDVDLGLQYATRVVGLRNGEIVLDKPVNAVNRAELTELYENVDTSRKEKVACVKAS